MPTAFANNTAVTTAKYTITSTDRGASYPSATRWLCTIEKTIRNAVLRAYGEGLDQATAESQARTAINSLRDHRYGAAAAGGSKHRDDGSTVLTVDSD